MFLRSTQGKPEFGYTRKDIILIGGGLIGFGFALYYGLQAAGVDALVAGNYVQLFVFVGICLGYISTYFYRVANKVLLVASCVVCNGVTWVREGPVGTWGSNAALLWYMCSILQKCLGVCAKVMKEFEVCDYNSPLQFYHVYSLMWPRTSEIGRWPRKSEIGKVSAAGHDVC